MYKRRYQYPMTFVLPKYTWDKDRKLCERCQHCVSVETGQTKGKKSVSMYCSISNRKNLFGGTSCIDERTNGICGSKGTLFKRKSTSC